jgi:pyruvate dehydrogenase E1 component alpha subunit
MVTTLKELAVGKELALDFYRTMTLIRRFEERCAEWYGRAKIGGFLHLYIGEEAIAAGAFARLAPQDYIVSHYREHGHALARGLDPKRIMAELFGRATGTSKGKGGSMHLFDASKGFLGGYAIVGGMMPVATGLALAGKSEDRLCLCIFGDGAVNEGEFHESLNLASLWKLPVLFFLENNLYGMGTHVERTRAGGKDIYTAADAYKIPAAQIDGMDVVAVREATEESLKRVRSGDGPVFLEAMTYRFRGHSLADSSAYRDSEEVDRWREKDPISTFKKLALSDGLLEDGEIERIDEAVEAQVAEAVQFGEDSDDPRPEALYEDVYA